MTLKRLKETWDDKCDRCDQPAVCHTEDGCDLCVDHSEDTCTCHTCKAPMGLATSVFNYNGMDYCLSCYDKAKTNMKSDHVCECGKPASGTMFFGAGMERKSVCQECWMKPAKKKTETEKEKIGSPVSYRCEKCRTQGVRLLWTRNNEGTRWLCDLCIKKEKEEADLANQSKKPLKRKRCDCGMKLKKHQEHFCDECFEKNYTEMFGSGVDDIPDEPADPYEPVTLDQIIIMRDYDPAPKKKGKFNEREVNKVVHAAMLEEKGKTNEKPISISREPVTVDKIHGWFVWTEDEVQFRGKWASIPPVGYDPNNKPTSAELREYARLWLQDQKSQGRKESKLDA